MAADYFIGESLVGEGNEVAHIDLIIGSKTGPAGQAFLNCLSNNKDGFTSLLAVVAPNLPCKPDTLLFNKVTIKGAKQAVQMFGPAQAAVARAVVDSVSSGVIPKDKANDYVILVDVNVLMYAVGAEHPNKAKSIEFLDAVAAGQRDATLDAEVLQEILHRYCALNRWADAR